MCPVAPLDQRGQKEKRDVIAQHRKELSVPHLTDVHRNGLRSCYVLAPSLAARGLFPSPGTSNRPHRDGFCGRLCRCPKSRQSVCNRSDHKRSSGEITHALLIHHAHYGPTNPEMHPLDRGRSHRKNEPCAVMASEGQIWANRRN